MKYFPVLMQQHRLAMEAEVQDGKLFREQERVIYARLEDLSVLDNAASADAQEQWMIKILKTDKNAAKGQIRSRKTTEMTKVNGVYNVPEDAEPQYTMTGKAEKNADDRLEVPVPVTKDMFDVFKLIADNGMIKHRYHFPIEGTDLVFEVDAFPKGDGGYHEWVKIDLEFKGELKEIPELPFPVAEKILDKTTDETEKKKMWELYETIFLAKNSAKAPVKDDGDHEYR